ncbi:hypothetical protein BU23DRAFT_555749 [Bimuria novae-zelandiae CBS 107.79]|uniref:Uncharacterized protein n=1 Tax=Bimuria novae-zelandiae CBS 107.79 TaxID=1447943 RepID=A0A6A5V3Y8_9PLEO|nr:hypothetical protein BU23DRAFT_555749 [Bimuria novae-zelandiae CBS 107.79]
MLANTVPHRQLDEPSGDMVTDQASPLVTPDAQREVLPAYEASPSEAAPSYNREVHATPIHTYYLRAPDRKNLMVVPYGPSASGSYKITSRSSLPFSKKPEMEVFRTTRASAPKDDEHVAGMWFDTYGPFPWCPRARFIHHDETYRLEAQNFSDWTISVNGTSYTWLLEAKPFSLVLRANDAQDTIARFNFSAYGLVATGGQEAGNLTIYQDELSQDRAGVELILCSLIIALLHFKKTGRHYMNEPRAMQERGRLPEERVPLHRTGVTPF